MAIQKINLGTEPHGVGGDSYRTANDKINMNFEEVSTNITNVDEKYSNTEVKITEEIARAKQVEDELIADLGQEVSRAVSAEADILGVVESESRARTAEDIRINEAQTQMKSFVDSEIERLNLKDASIKTDLEKTHRYAVMSQTLGLGSKFYGEDGQPLSGGKVYTYESGTSTLLDTYKDAEFQVSNTNPIVLDETGSADVFLKGIYRFRIFDKNDNFIEEQEDVNQTASVFELNPIISSLYLANQEISKVKTELEKVKKDTGIEVTPKFEGAIVRTQANKNAEHISVKDFGAVGDGHKDDTAAIQAAFDSAGNSAIYFPAGLYRVTGTGDACLTLSRNRRIYGDGLGTIIRADNAGAETSLLKIKFTYSAGYADVRHWFMENIKLMFNGGGKHGLFIDEGMIISNSAIMGCAVGVGSHPDAYAIMIKNNWSHSEIYNCLFASAYMNCHDANVIYKCSMFGKKAAVTFNCDFGIRNNTVRDCTIVTRDGVMEIINGDNIRLLNNQCELAQIYSPTQNQNEFGAMVIVRGVDRPCVNTVIEDNNFGGGTNLDRSVYLGNSMGAVIDKNQFIAVNKADVEFSSSSKYNYLGGRNSVVTQVINKRDDKIFRLKTVDNGIGNMGVVKKSAGLNGWGSTRYYKNEFGSVVFLDPISGSTIEPNTSIGRISTDAAPIPTQDSSVRNLIKSGVDVSKWYLSSVLANKYPDALNPLGGRGCYEAVATTSNSMHFASLSFDCTSGSQYVSSIYLKKPNSSTNNNVLLELSSLEKPLYFMRVSVDLSALTATNKSSNGNYFTGIQITTNDAGNGWVRVIVKFTSVDSVRLSLRVVPRDVASAGTVFTGNPLVDSVFAWGAQTEVGTEVTEYQDVDDAGNKTTLLQSRLLPVMTDSGSGSVYIRSDGYIKVHNLPSGSNVVIPPFHSLTHNYL